MAAGAAPTAAGLPAADARTHYVSKTYGPAPFGTHIACQWATNIAGTVEDAMANRDRIQSTLWRRLRGVLGVPVAVLLAVAVPGTAAGQSRLKDIVEFEGVRDNMLVGYGLVVGGAGMQIVLRGPARP